MSKKSVHKTSLPEIFISENISTYDAFGKYYRDSSGKLLEFKKNVRERKYTGHEAGISYRTINYWASNKIFPDGVNSESGWKKFNYIELAWLEAVNRLRGFGLSLSKIKRVKEGVMGWDQIDDVYPQFEFAIYRAFSKNNDPFIAVRIDGVAQIAEAQEIERSKALNGSLDLLLLSIKSLIEKVWKVHLARTRTLYPLKNTEKKLLHEIRSGKNKEINARLNNEEITKLEVMQGHPVAPDLNQIMKELRAKGMHGDVIVHMENGVEQSAEVKMRERFK